MDLNYVSIEFSSKESLSCLKNMEKVFQVIDEIKAVVKKEGGEADFSRGPSLSFHEDTCEFLLSVTLKNIGS